LISCEKCEYWYVQENNPDFGVCKRNAPSPKVRPDGGGMIGAFSDRSVWPYVRRADGCGQGVYKIEPKPIAEEQTIPPNPQDMFRNKIADAMANTDTDKFNKMVDVARRLN
jgi:hypothetical protein